MKTPPEKIDGANVICYSPIDARHCDRYAEIGRTPSGVAICHYPDSTEVYLFTCDANWNTTGDWDEESLDEAKQSAECMYEGIAQTWIFPDAGK